MRDAKAFELDAKTDRELRVLSQRMRIEVRLRQRARIVLLVTQGMHNKAIAGEVGPDRRQLAQWRSRFLEGGIEALCKDALRSGRPATVMSEMESRIVHVTQQLVVDNHATHSHPEVQDWMSNPRFVMHFTRPALRG